MGQELQRRTPGAVSPRADPSWPAVANTTMRLWLDRHYRRRAGRRRLVLVVSALVAMAVGAGVTLAFTERGQAAPARPGVTAPSPNALQVAGADRGQAATWIAREVAPNIVVGCDPEMCTALQHSGFPAGQLMELQPSAPDPLGSQLIVATPVIRSPFGTRLTTVYAPLVIAAFGSGAERVEVLYIAPDGSKAFESRLGTERRSRVAAGQQLVTNKHVQASAAARTALLAVQVHTRLLVTLSTLADLMPIHLIAFDDPSPGASPDVPLRGAELGAAAPTGLPAGVPFLRGPQSQYPPAVARQPAGAK